MKTEIIENNRLIAEFMGYAPASSQIEWEDLDHIENKIYVSEFDSPYQSSWDWLMPVVFECTNKGLDIEIRSMQVKTYKPLLKFYPVKPKPDNWEYIDETKVIGAVWQAVVEFIKWYNTKNA